MQKDIVCGAATGGGRGAMPPGGMHTTEGEQLGKQTSVFCYIANEIKTISITHCSTAHAGSGAFSKHYTMIASRKHDFDSPVLEGIRHTRGIETVTSFSA
eukprot:1158100-Pelagomonas_calceolata.AAC.4